MNWYKHLYVGKTYEKKKWRIIRRITTGRRVPELYLLLARLDTGQNQLELYTQKDFYESGLKHEALIVGIACGRGEAEELLLALTEEVYRATGGAALRDYIFAGQGIELE